MTDDASPENLRKFLESDDPAIVRMGISLAKGMKVPDSYKLVMALSLWDSEEGNREAAKELVEEIGIENIIDKEKDSSATDKEILVRELSRENAVVPLIMALGDEDEYVRQHAAEALGKIGKPAVEPLIKVFEDENNEDRAIAAEALGKIGKPAVEPLIKVLEDENNEGRAVAAEALGKIGDARAVEPLIQALEKSEEYEEELNQEIIFALGELGDKKAIDTLCSKMEIDEGYYDWQSCLLEAVGKIGDPGAAWFLVEALGGWYDDEKINGLWAGDALSALKNIGEPAVDAVTTVLYGCGGESFTNRDSWEVLNETIGWLREVIGDKKTSSILLKLLKEDISGKEHDHRDYWSGCPLCSSIQARACAAICLGNMEHDSALEKLAEVQELILSESEEIDDAERDISYGSATYLTLVLGAQGKVGDVQAVEQLINALGDEDEFIRKAATEALGVIGDKRAVEPLIKLLSYDKGGYYDYKIRESAKEALVKISEKNKGKDKENILRILEAKTEAEAKAKAEAEEAEAEAKAEAEGKRKKKQFEDIIASISKGFNDPGRIERLIEEKYSKEYEDLLTGIDKGVFDPSDWVDDGPVYSFLKKVFEESKE